MILAGFQRRYLRALAQPRRAAAHIGNKGVTDAVVGHVEQLLVADELVKVRGTGDRAGLAAMASEVATRVGAELVGVVGKSILLYRAHPVAPRIHLPDRADA